MAKLRTNSAISKRFRRTKNNKILRKKSTKSHLLEKKSSNKKRNLRKITQVSHGDTKGLLAKLPYHY